MSSTQNTRAIPIRAIVMILLALAIAFAAVGVHGFTTRNDDPQAALNAQESKIQAAADQAPGAATKPAVCLIAVSKASLADATDRLTKAGLPPAAETAVWPAQPAAPRATTVYFDEGAQDQAKTVQAALPGSAVAPRPAGLEECGKAIAVAVVKK